MKRQQRAALALVVVLTVACATVGTGDPVVVKAEDVLSNSLTVYDAAMSYHFANSTKETPATYKVLENVRVKFPTAWKALYDSLTTYKVNKTAAGANLVNAYLAALQTLVSEAQPLIGGH